MIKIYVPLGRVPAGESMIPFVERGRGRKEGASCIAQLEPASLVLSGQDCRIDGSILIR